MFAPPHRVYRTEPLLLRVFQRSFLSRTFKRSANNSPQSSAIPTEDFLNAPESRVSKYLWHRYESGGRLQRASERSDRFDKKGLMKWGESGIPIRFTVGQNPTEIWRTFRAPNLWLRDNCRCSKCVNQDTMQRAFDTFALPENIEPKDVVTEKEGLRVTWANDNHVSVYPWEWLFRHKGSYSTDFDIPKTNEKVYWSSEIKYQPPSVSYEEVMSFDAGVGTWLSKVRTFGFCYVDNCPVDPIATQKLLERIAFIRLTHYGGFYDFTSDLTLKDTAYTSEALGPHTDNTYFSDPSGLQMLHLLSHEEGEGGESLFVDGFNAARTLLTEDASSYEILANTPVPWHASGNEGVTITPSKNFPVLDLEAGKPFHEAALLQVRWNNDDRGVVEVRDDPEHVSSAELWYLAARKWDAILKREHMQYRPRLEPGRPIIFDNWRVLHGRAAFTGKRRMCGGYINRDDWISRWRNTNFEREEVIKQIL
ncbi:hypothetical protein B0O99DRAFT_571411 [Bisporella sp. PMI_857]|nr:hypothetical protein B0O99DRAFT_571411 [Bisporella sp. PMI_857]